ncbi:thioredoxin family protein [Pedobacter sp. FW305-3-2-15-E-R2A2]|uniref:thioredoxin family protein n=1 Tax=Pedobacter sp. FW305-3-2-15-E-R2A2 TaxID=3140251 RepID=UPI0031407C08
MTIKNITTILLLLIGGSIKAQEGIKFNQTSNWKETTEKAAAENKLIFIDCYTSWCGPCKWMDQNVFVDPSVGAFFNKNFINAKIDMEKGEGIALAKKYNVRSFPTFLFVNDKGEVIHRTASRMPVAEFLEEGKMASDPGRNFSSMKKKYESGQRDLAFVLDYYLTLQKSERGTADNIGKDIVAKITAEELNSALGWKAVKALARSETDRLGAYFMANQARFAAWSSVAEREELTDRLISSSMYGYIYAKDEPAFMKKLAFFNTSDKADRRKQGAMLEADFYLEQNRTADYKKVTDAALKGILKTDAEKLSFLARRADYKAASNPEILEQAYLLAKRSVALAPEEYSIQSTFAKVCLSLKKKEEGLKAAKKSRLLADAETSKIQKLSQELLDKIELL